MVLLGHLPKRSDADSSRLTWVSWWLWKTLRGFVTFIVLLALWTSWGCGSSEQAPSEADEPPFEVSRLMTLPSGLGLLHQQAKPGHWSAATLDIKANHETFRGQLASEIRTEQSMPFRLEIRRTVLLPRKRPKSPELLFYVPTGTFGDTKAPLDIRLFRSFDSRHPLLTDKNRLQRLMPAHEYYFLVLANEPDRYRFLDPDESGVEQSNNACWLRTRQYPNYEVLLPKVKQRPPLASNALAWSMLSHILWDGFDPQQFTKPQQQAMLDWLHWGGQLIVNGPGSLELLHQSFLAPYLPAESEGPLELTSADIEQLGRQLAADHPPLVAQGSWLGESLRPQTGSETLVGLHDRPLIVDRRVGRGRVVVSAFAINHHELVKWPGVGVFFDRFLLRRPPREATAMLSPTPFEPHRNTRFRILSRDGGSKIHVRLAQTSQLKRSQWQFWSEQATQRDNSVPSITGGTGAWNDHSLVSHMAQHILRSASRIEAPDVGFVARLLGLYLVVLIPINWGVFRLLGRPHWAWFAVPPISFAFTAIVVWAVRLDIGFVRSLNEVRLVEIQANYARAHVTHYTSLYSSLSTTYRVRYDSPTAVAMPWVGGVGTIFRQRRPLVVLDQGPPVELRNLEIASNTTSILHGEYFVDLPGTIALETTPSDGWRVRNNTGLDLENTVVIAGDRVAEIGRLPNGATATIELAAHQPRLPNRRPRPPANRPDGRTTSALEQHGSSFTGEPTASESDNVPTGPEALDPTPLFEAVKHLDADERGQWRLVARCRRAPGRVQIIPTVHQVRRSAIVVAYLKHAPLPNVTPDDSNNASSPQTHGK